MLFNSKDRKRFAAIVHGGKWRENYRTTGPDEVQFADEKYAVLWRMYVLVCSPEQRDTTDFEALSLDVYRQIDDAIRSQNCAEYLRDFWVRFLLSLDAPPRWVSEFSAQIFYYRARVDRLVRTTFVIPG